LLLALARRARVLPVSRGRALPLDLETRERALAYALSSYCAVVSCSLFTHHCNYTLVGWG